MIIMLSFPVFGQVGLQLTSPVTGKYRPLFETSEVSPLIEMNDHLRDTTTLSFIQDTLIIDFESRQISYSQYDTLTGLILRSFHYSEMTEYIEDMEKHARRILWNDIMIEKGDIEDQDGPVLRFALPAHLPAWATRIVGTSPPQMSITGSQKIKFGVKRSTRSTDGVEDEGASSTDPIFEPTSDFVIKGSLGRLVKLEIRLHGKKNSSGDFEFDSVEDQLSNMTFEYREDSVGELEDDIIQEIVIGRTSFNMPGQGLAGYSSGSNEGLFGVKVRSQIGPLSLTTIASMEQVETQKKDINLSASNSEIKIGEKQMQKNRFFFLDELYRLKYLNSFLPSNRYKEYRDEQGLDSDPVIKSLSVYKKTTEQSKPENSNKEYTWANYTIEGVQNNQPSLFIKLEEGKDFFVDKFRGTVRFQSQLADNDVIGIYLEYTDATIDSKGDISTNANDDLGLKSVIEDLWVLKNDRSLTKISDETYPLMMRNVYTFTANATNPNFTIKRKVDNDLQEINEDGIYYGKLFGLMDDNNEYNYDNPELFDLANGFVFFPPYDSTVTDTSYNDITAMQPFSNKALGTHSGEASFGSIIYDDKNLTNWDNRFSMITTSKTKKDRFNLDFGVVKDSETLTAGGSPLTRNEDYTIDYSMGFVTLISDFAKSATVISAEYQKESLFFLEKKVFLGVNGRVDLPNIGRNSYFGTTFMWQIMQSKSLMPKVGTEPFNRFLFDANLELDFEPEWMTSLTNLVPGISTNANSSARFSIEVAHSKARNSTDTDGEAYIDNFSTSARNYSLRTDEHLWSKASPDEEWIKSWEENPPAWSAHWFKPLKDHHTTLRTEIFPPLKDGSDQEINKDTKLSLLRFVVQPYPDHDSLRSTVSETDGSSKMISKVNPWAGITYGLNGSLKDRRNDRYFEFWIRRKSWLSALTRASGELIIDLGTVSEDISISGLEPNQNANFELVNATLKADTDLGIDTTDDNDEVYYYPNYSQGSDPVMTKYTINDSLFFSPLYTNDPAHDNWQRYDGEDNKNSIYVNGTEGNFQIKSTPDSEDANKDGIIYVGSGSYFRYRLDLANIESSKYYSSTETAHQSQSGWVKIRIPIGDNATDDMVDSKVNSPSWDQISHVRFLWHNFDSTVVGTEGYVDTLEFAEMNFVGNVWREQITDSIDVGKVTATIEDSKTNSSYYRPMTKAPENVTPNEEAIDYTLVLDFKGIYSDSTVVAFRNLNSYQAMDLTRYKDIRFWAEDPDRQITTSRNSWLTFRFGENDSTYYEFKTQRLIDDAGSVTDNIGWNSDDGIIINLREFTELKNKQFAEFGERMDTVNRAYTNLVGDTIRIYSRTQIMPSISSIKWMALGVSNHTGSDYVGKIRINGLRATGIEDRDGWALRSSMDLDFADFMSTNVNYQYTDADFRSMAQDIHTTSNSEMRTGVSGKLQLHKFIPDRAGVRLPFGASVSASLNRPEMRRNSDISLRQNGTEADGMADMGEDFWDLLSGAPEDSADTPSEQYQTTSKDYRIFTSYQKTAAAQNPLINLTADRIGVEYAYSVSEGTTRNGYMSDSDRVNVYETNSMFHIDENKSNTHNFSLDYDFTPSTKARNQISWQPFRETTNRNIPRKVKSMKLQLLPKTFKFDLIKMDYGWTKDYNSIFEARDSNNTYQFLEKENLGISHKLDFSYEPLYPFTTINFTVNSQRNFDSYLKNWNQSGVNNFVNDGLFSYNETWKDYYILNMENNRNHTTSFRFAPDVFTWLTPSATLSSSYSQNVDMLSDTSSYMKGNLNSNFTSNLKFKIRQSFLNMGKWGDGGWSKSMNAVASGLDAIDLENFTFDYNAKMNVTSSYLDTDYLNNSLSNGAGSYYAYTIGLYHRNFSDIVRGEMNDSTSFGGVQDRTTGRDSTTLNSNDTRRTTQSFRGATSVKIPFSSGIKIDQISLRWNRSYTIFQTYGQMDTSITWPEMRISGSSPLLRKIPTIDKYFNSFNVRTGFRYAKTVKRTSSLFLGEKESSSPVNQDVKYSYALDPLVKVDGVLKKRRIDMSYSLGVVFDTTERSVEDWVDSVDLWQSSGIDGRFDVTFNHVWTAGYKIQGERGRTIPMFRGNQMEIKGDMRFSAQVDYKAVNHRTSNLREDTEEEWKDSYLNITPRIEYDLTRKIGFSLFYSLRNQTVGSDQKSQHEGILAGELKITF